MPAGFLIYENSVPVPGIFVHRGRGGEVRIGQSLKKGDGRGPLRQSFEPAPELVDSIQPPEKRDRIVEGVARRVTFELGLPWRLTNLREKAAEAYDAAEPPPASLGLTHKAASKRMLRQVYGQVKKAGEEMDRLPGGQSKPTPEQIEAAIEAFTTREWTPVEQWPPLALSPPKEDWPVVEARYGLMESVGRAEVEALLDYIRRNKAGLAQRIRAKKLNAIEGRAIERSSMLWLDENRSKLVPVSDAYWAWAWRALFREASVRRKGPRVAEQSHAPSIARRLTKRDVQTGREMNVSAYRVTQLWKRWAELFADRRADDAESRAELLLDPDWWVIIHSTAAYKEYLRTRERREE